MHVLLLRHGQTDDNARGVLQGHTPTRLNALGRRQAEALAARLASYSPPVEALVSSDLPRAAETAEVIARALNLPVETTEVWRERAFGPFEGRAIGEAYLWREATGSWDLPGAEPTEAFRARIRSALLDVVERFQGRKAVAVVSHGAAINTVLRLLAEGDVPLGEGEMPPDLSPIDNCAIVDLRVERSDGTVVWRVTRLNDTSHLATEVEAFTLERQPR